MRVKTRYPGTMKGGRERQGSNTWKLSSSQAIRLARIIQSLVRLQREIAHSLGHRGLIAESLALLALADNMVAEFERGMNLELPLQNMEISENPHAGEEEEELDGDLPF